MDNSQLSMFSETKKKTTKKVLDRAQLSVLKIANNIMLYGTTRCHDIERELGGASELYRPDVISNVRYGIETHVLPAVMKVAQQWASDANDKRREYKASVKNKEQEQIASEVAALEKKLGIKLTIQK